MNIKYDINTQESNQQYFAHLKELNFLITIHMENHIKVIFCTVSKHTYFIDHCSLLAYTCFLACEKPSSQSGAWECCQPGSHGLLLQLDSLAHSRCPCCRVWTLFTCPQPLLTNGESLLRGERRNDSAQACSRRIRTAQTVTHTHTHVHTLSSSPSDANHYQVVITWQLSPSLHPGHNTSSLMRQLQSQSLIFGPKCSPSAKWSRLRVG